MILKGIRNLKTVNTQVVHYPQLQRVWDSFQIGCGVSYTHAFARVYSDPDIVLTKVPFRVWETDVELKEGGEWGRERYEGWTNSLAALKGIVLPAPFSH